MSATSSASLLPAASTSATVNCHLLSDHASSSTSETHNAMKPATPPRHSGMEETVSARQGALICCATIACAMWRVTIRNASGTTSVAVPLTALKGDCSRTEPVNQLAMCLSVASTAATASAMLEVLRLTSPRARESVSTTPAVLPTSDKKAGAQMLALSVLRGRNRRFRKTSSLCSPLQPVSGQPKDVRPLPGLCQLAVKPNSPA